MIELLADIGIGILSAIFVNQFFKTKISLTMVLVGIIFALLPDTDSLIKGRLSGKFTHLHRDLFHFPLLYISIGSAFVVWFGHVWLFLFLFNSLLHFLHDSVGIGWGVKWIFPFSRRSFKFFSFRKFIISWNEEEQKKVAEKYGNENWIKDIYFRPTLVSISEFVLFIFSLIFLFIKLKS